MTRTAKLQTKLHMGATLLVTDPEIVFGLEGLDGRDDDFVFDV
jgi:hypothetical protein